eukprot:1158545-Pelagomonas_calceolata.AAC.1
MPSCCARATRLLSCLPVNLFALVCRCKAVFFRGGKRMQEGAQHGGAAWDEANLWCEVELTPVLDNIF